MPYENATATTLVATRCAVCGRPLVDAQSVETGIGPICRDRYLVPDALSEEARAEANTIIYRVAAELSRDPSDTNVTNVAADLQRLRELGAVTIVERILQGRGRLAKIKIVLSDRDGSRFAVVSPRNDAVTLAFRAVPNRRWYGSRDAWYGTNLVNVFPRSQWPLVRAALRATFGDAFVKIGDSVMILTADATPGFDVPAVDANEPAPSTEFRATIRTAPGRRIIVSSPYNADIVAAFRNVWGRRYAGGNDNSFPGSSLGAVIRAIRRVVPNAVIDAPGFELHAVASVARDMAAVMDDPAQANAMAELADSEPSVPASDIGAPAAADGWLDRARHHATDALPAVDYSERHSSWLAESIEATLTAGGFSPVTLPNVREIVYGIRLADGTNLLVYTSITGSGRMRSYGSDAIRVAAVRDGRGVGSTTRINRTGTITAIVSRVLDRAAELSAA